jgi:thiosulfate/3-mercaptopyruvate sulfurtransferase
MSYAHPEVLVSSEWVQTHLNDPKVRVVEVDYDPVANYQLGHVPGAILFDWKKDLNHPLEDSTLWRFQ